MDPITHGLIGALIARAVDFNKFSERYKMSLSSSDLFNYMSDPSKVLYK